MDETKLELLRSGSAVFNASGVATVVLTNAGLTRWQINNTAVSTTSAAKTVCTTYRKVAVATNQIDYTRNGNGNSSDTIIPLMPSDYITVQWTGGTPGAVGTVAIQGDEFMRGRRAY